MSAQRHAEKTYSDGHPLDAVHYREFKILLKPDHFTEAHHFKQFGKLLRHAAEELEVALFTDQVESTENQVREVVFYDTHDFDLYNQHFILRRRTRFEDGFPIATPELALKFRHPDVDVAAAVDVRPHGAGEARIKFKEELLPLTDRLGGMRCLYSHNAVLELPHDDVDAAVKHPTTTFPCLHGVQLCERTLALVNDVAVEEVLHDLGELHFGHGIAAKANVAVWRRRADEKPLVGEFAFQCKFARGDELHSKASRRAEKFFVALQHGVRDWVQLGTTKTRIVYAMGAGGVRNRE
ncbi:MAG: hypothetical protein KIT14_05035 [bacterium]|nr:hypothetical protein [bacterium]